MNWNRLIENRQNIVKSILSNFLHIKTDSKSDFLFSAIRYKKSHITYSIYEEVKCFSLTISLKKDAVYCRWIEWLLDYQ
ncbi:unnamed protein product [Rhizophagus irregularis]|uniref:Uncharacterized protein n=1 Tax=Rhizophagus irregularis TaxID=588596 RepID=A0A915YY13_9GLOM|nr:unnamed protein product [Rhizophagus irregularis]